MQKEHFLMKERWRDGIAYNGMQMVRFNHLIPQNVSGRHSDLWSLRPRFLFIWTLIIHSPILISTIGTIDEVTNEAAFNGTTCLKFSQTYNRQYHGRYTNMVHVLDAARLGRTGYYGFAFKLDKNWQFDPNWVTLMKFMADFGDVDCGHHRR